MSIRPISPFRIGGVVVLVCAGWLASQGLARPLVDDPAGGPPAAPKARLSTASGLNDMLGPVARVESLNSAAQPRSVEPVAAWAPSNRLLSDRLRAWDDRTRRNAQISVELPSAASAAVRELAERVEGAWQAGQHDLAITQLRWLETGGTPVALGVNWVTPRSADESREYNDVRIGARTGGATTSLDFDAASGKLFALVRWDVANGWALYMSADDGSTWTETYFWSAGSGEHAVSADLAVVANYAYVGYVASNVAAEGRIRRCLVSSGANDAAYGFKISLDAGASTITEVKLASNADQFGNRVYYALRQANNAVRFAYGVASTGTTFNEFSPTSASSVGGLDVCYNPGYEAYYMLISYIGTDSRVHVTRLWDPGWIEATSAPFDGSHTRSAISAWDDHIICAHELQMVHGQGIRYFISHNGGDSWDFYNYVAEPDAGEGPYQMADVTARGGAGTAIIFTHEVGEPDDVLIRYRRDYNPGLWHDAIRVNNNDVSTGTWTTLSWTPRDTAHVNELSYGGIYFFGTTPYINRLQRRVGDVNCDGVVDFFDIDPFVVALSGQAAFDFVFPDCDWWSADCNENGVIDFFDIDPFVAVLSEG